VETIGKIRRWHRIEKLSISQIARRLGASRNTVKKYLKSNVTTHPSTWRGPSASR
jgi:IS30 family transposase